MAIIDVKILPENQYWLWGDSKKEFYLYIELQGKKVEYTQKKPPLNISLVIDRSGSMQGDKLNYAKKAIDFVIDNVSENDFISIVQYDDKIEVVSKSEKVHNKASLHQKVKQIASRNTTNLSGGMLEGYNQVISTKASNFVNRVLLLSDGLANEGVTDPIKLQQIAQKKFREDGVALSTFGVGADFDEKLMTNLAEYGGANYYFIDSPDKIPQIFAKELEGLLAVIAQNTNLKISFPNDYLSCQKVYGYPHSLQNEAVIVNFNDVFSGEKKAILLKFEVKKPIEQNFQFTVQLSYSDVAETYNQIKHLEEIKIQTTVSSEMQKMNVSHEVLANIALFESNEWLEIATDEADNDNFEKAKEWTLKNRVYLETIFKIITPTQELQKQYQAVIAYEKQLENMKEMSKADFMMAQKATRSVAYTQKKKR
jgi:Ca-activated chloride channel family protein